MTESVLLSLLGGVLGILLAYAGVGVFRRIAPNNMVRLDEIHIDPTTLGFALGLVLLTGVLVGLVPGLRTCRPDLNDATQIGQPRHHPGFQATAAWRICS